MRVLGLYAFPFRSAPQQLARTETAQGKSGGGSSETGDRPELVGDKQRDQIKKGKLDSSGMTPKGNVNVAEIHHQALMMLGHEIFDPEIGKEVLVDHAFIVAGGEINKAARNWLGQRLDATQRRSIIFMDRQDILNLYVVTNLPLPSAAWPKAASAFGDESPF